MSRPHSTSDFARLSLHDPEPKEDDVDSSDLFASPTTTPVPAPHKRDQKKPSHSSPSQTTAREDALRAELAQIRAVNDTISNLTTSLETASKNMSTVHSTVSNASTLLATWTRILSQTEHNQRLILDPTWQGASRDLEDAEAEEVRRGEERERREMEERRRKEEGERKREEEERRREVAASKTTRGMGRTRSTRAGAGTAGSAGRGYTGVGGQAGRGRGSTAGTRGSGIGRGAGAGAARGRGKG